MKYRVGDFVLVEHNFFLQPKTVWAIVLGWDTPFWGLLGRRYLLEASVKWVDGGWTQTDKFTKYEWQISFYQDGTPSKKKGIHNKRK